MTRFPTIRRLQSAVGRLLERLLWRWQPYKRLTSRLVWAELERDADFMEGLRRGKADADAGRLYFYSSDASGEPCPSWRPDDPQQPKGFHHDGKRWVRNNDGGWWVDRSGFWRYNAPGDIGWVELPDRWEYRT